MWRANAQLSMASYERQVHSRFKGVELELHSMKLRPNIACDFLPQVADAECAADQDAQKGAYKKDEQDHRSHLDAIDA
jgi:hypothetical protein